MTSGWYSLDSTIPGDGDDHQSEEIDTVELTYFTPGELDLMRSAVAMMLRSNQAMRDEPLQRPRVVEVANKRIQICTSILTKLTVFEEATKS